MGLYFFYDVNEGHLINDFEKEAKKKSSQGKNMKVNLTKSKNLIKNFFYRMNGRKNMQHSI